MRTPSIMTSFYSPSVAFVLHQNLKINSSEQPSPQMNSSTGSNIPPGFGMSCFTMIFGAISNLTALGILTKARIKFRRQSKAPFLLLTVALLLADLGGHVIPGSFALYLHIEKFKMQTEMPNDGFCRVFGANMVFFGLCSLLLGCAMAVERCVAITQPFFHTAMITVGHARLVVLFLSSIALMLAILPFFAVGTYTTQFPGTWCFLPIHGAQSTADTSLVLAFTCLGLIALILSLLCNIISGVTLLFARIKSCNANTKSAARPSRRGSSVSSYSLVCSLDLEMMLQLSVVTLVSCVCWSPFLVSMHCFCLQNCFFPSILVWYLKHIVSSTLQIQILVMQFRQSPWASTREKDVYILLGLRMAAWNQILDPWVYILLRRAVFFRVCCVFYTERSMLPDNSFFASTRRETISLQ